MIRHEKASGEDAIEDFWSRLRPEDFGRADRAIEAARAWADGVSPE